MRRLARNSGSTALIIALAACGTNAPTGAHPALATESPDAAAATRINLHSPDIPDLLPDPSLSTSPMALMLRLMDACRPSAKPGAGDPLLGAFRSQFYVGNRRQVVSAVTFGNPAELLARAAALRSNSTTTCINRAIADAFAAHSSTAVGSRFHATNTGDLVRGIGDGAFSQSITLTAPDGVGRFTTAGVVVGRVLVTVLYFTVPRPCLPVVTKAGAPDPHSCSTAPDAGDLAVPQLLTVMAQRARTK